MEQKFKIGNLVRCKADGEIGKVLGFGQGRYAVCWNDAPWTGESCVWSEDELELVQEEVKEHQEAMVVGVSSTVTPRSSWAGDLTLRDRFAMAALTGLMSAHASDGTWSVMGAIDEAAKFSYAAADAMIEARKKHS